MLVIQDAGNTHLLARAFYCAERSVLKCCWILMDNGNVIADLLTSFLIAIRLHVYKRE